MKRPHLHRADRAGVALLTALAFLILFAVVGTVFLRFMTLEADKTRLVADQVRARQAAVAGVEAAIGNIEAAFAEGTLNGLFAQGPITLEVPVYKPDPAAGLTVDERFRGAMVTVRLSDECARVNINHVPSSVLRHVLNVDGSRARQIRASLPRSDEEMSGPGPAQRRWLTSVDDLVAREFLTPQEFAAIDTTLLTVYTAPDPDTARAFINVNSVPPTILEGILEVSPGIAQQVAAGRPYSTLEALIAAAGKDASTFNIRPEPETPDLLPKALSFTSNSVRISSEASLMRSGERAVATARAEAVVVLGAGPRPVITYWFES